jgi:hypothetical protein
LRWGLTDEHGELGGGEVAAVLGVELADDEIALAERA